MVLSPWLLCSVLPCDLRPQCIFSSYTYICLPVKPCLSEIYHDMDSPRGMQAHTYIYHLMCMNARHIVNLTPESGCFCSRRYGQRRYLFIWSCLTLSILQVLDNQMDCTGCGTLINAQQMPDAENVGKLWAHTEPSQAGAEIEEIQSKRPRLDFNLGSAVSHSFSYITTVTR